MGRKRRSGFRRAPRLPAGWFGRYELVKPRGEAWYPCRVIDVATGGVGLELLGSPASVGDRLRVDLQTPTPDIVGHAVHAVVRRVAPGYEGGIIVGAEFAQLDDAARAFVTELLVLQSDQGST